ncbi:serine/threonine-protein kinase [Aliikangiella sp. G2MR2-5]|uniref:serine/threonine-protein kinase n=1 Tax=Aliikangiella sp. G2MR2-5 TaxID=2788943 RepID=UPI0018AAC9EE|nr:serine/threonine-protein kinase [Aliikangiella sp. G2MR2-5]
MTNSRVLPFHHTGWFYLLLICFVAVFGLLWGGQFSVVEQWNRDLLYRVFPQQENTSKAASVKVELSDRESLIRLINRLPQTKFILSSKAPEKWLNSIAGVLESSVGKNQLDNLVILSTRQTTENGLFARADSWTFIGHGWRYLQDDKELTWRTDNDVVVAPLMSRDAAFSALWHSGKYFQPAAVAWILAGVGQAQPELSAQANLALTVGEQFYPLGYNGKVYGGGKAVDTIGLDSLLQMQPQSAPNLILLQHSGFEIDELLSQIVARLEQKNYLTQSWATILLNTFLWVLLTLAATLVARQRGVVQIVSISGIVTLLVLCQYLAFTQHQWFSVIPLASLLAIVFILVNAYFYEYRRFSRLQAEQSRLLALTAPYLYQARDFEKIQPWLESVEPGEQLSETLFDLGLRAEAENNRTFALKLFEWHERRTSGHKGALDKLNEYRQLEESENKDGLDSTLVIQPGQTSPGSVTNPIFQIESFGRYQVEGVLGRGAMGIVFQGVDPKINRHVAIKTLQLCAEDADEHFTENKDRFFREAETAGNLSHANIVTIYDVGEEGDLGYIAMDLLTGAPLSNFLKPESRLPVPLVYQLMIQITDALDYAHKQNVVHRDIKPANIIYDDDIQRVTLTDFGIAYVTDQSKTRTGTIVGSPFYMSPEQVMGKKVDGRSDIFSLGVTFYQLLSGHLPFGGESIASVAYHITKSKQESVRSWDSKLPASAVRITNKALQKDASKRFQTMLEFKQALISALKRDFRKAPIV